MQTKWIWALALLNVFLLVGLATHWMPSRAEAMGTPSGHPGDFLMIPGEIQGGGGSMVYIIDQNTGTLLSGLQYTGQVGAPVAIGPPLDLNRLLK